MQNKQYFDEIAPKWDELRWGFFSEAGKECPLLKTATARKTAADRGAGTGFITEGIIEHGLTFLQSTSLSQYYK